MPEQQDQPTEKRIIIDEGYKTQVQSEKERAATTGRPEPPRARPPLPPANFPLLLATLGTQALIALGFLPNPVNEKSEQDLEQAKHLIDMLGVLEEKTKGNLTADEKRQLDSLLFDLRLQYVEASKR
jgi:hypothetical protein